MFYAISSICPLAPYKQTTNKKQKLSIQMRHGNTLGTRETLILQHRSIVALAVQN